MPPPHPLRRISTGSLTSLARSTDRNTSSSSGLDHLTGAMVDLSDEVATLSSNIQRMTALHNALGTFNEAFAGYLYALKMNAFCVEWPQAPNEQSFSRIESLDVQEPSLTQPSSLMVPPTPVSAPSRTSSSALNPADMTYATAYSTSMDDDHPPAATAGGNRPKAGPVPGVRKPSGGLIAKKGNTVAAAKKKRELEISSIIDSLPLEYRGGEPAERIRMEKVISKLMDNPGGIPLKEMVFPPDLPQAKVNKCLITLVSKKMVAKPTVNKVTMYKWVGA
ncbi:uncharacterized protein IL334_006555 [Kwoniella shivajii]|uniref:DASH complex subunit DAM1 n=1 Tax=Kwoniella shivajii TaxID=564305 RepID=A0ABZ1DA70_9TREE|nr:hypothetical protein IL334_006555 [Kwoniella shivajii]